MKLIYFQFGGRAEPIRMAMKIGNIDFEDEHITFEEWPGLKAEMPLGGMPVLDVSGMRLSHSNTILRFVGKQSGLYPGDPLQAALCDQMMDTVEEILSPIGVSIGMQGDEQKGAREALCAGPLPYYLSAMEVMLGASDGPMVTGTKLTVADLKLTTFIEMVSSGRLDHVPTDIVERAAPALARHQAHVRALPEVIAASD